MSRKLRDPFARTALIIRNLSVMHEKDIEHA